MFENPVSSSDLNRVAGAVRLLVVDREPDIAEMIQQSFSGDGYTVDVLACGSDIYNLNLSDYSLILIDLSIDNNGLNYVEQIKQLYEDENIAIIAYSVKMSPETIIRALNAGADDYLINPFSIRELKARVRSVLRRR